MQSTIQPPTSSTARNVGAALPPFDSLTVANARAALALGVAAIRAGQTVFDLAALKVVDSSAVAVLLAWKRCARAAGSTLALTNLPANLQSLVSLYGVDALLGGPSAAASAPGNSH